MSNCVDKREEQDEISNAFVEFEEIVHWQKAAHVRIAHPSGQTPQHKQNHKRAIKIQQNAANPGNYELQIIRLFVIEILNDNKADLHEHVDENAEKIDQVVLVKGSSQILRLSQTFVQTRFA